SQRASASQPHEGTRPGTIEGKVGTGRKENGQEGFVIGAGDRGKVREKGAFRASELKLKP
ncbi:MAG: hypothetical protein PHF65_07895, partial [Oscillospiraceae bacterium]|nr:hypothetical protein [Oscillospiraceae bacterium]